jgi:hypothetical protein
MSQLLMSTDGTYYNLKNNNNNNITKIHKTTLNNSVFSATLQNLRIEYEYIKQIMFFKTKFQVF